MSKTVFASALMLLPGRRSVKGDIVVDGGRIVAIVPDGVERTREADEKTVDCSGLLAMPGLINCHGHTAMTLVRGLGGGLPLDRWLNEAIFPVEARMKPEDIRAGTLWGALEMLAGGTVQVADMYDFPFAAEEAFSQSGMKASLNRVGLAFADDVPPGRLAECVDYLKLGCTDKFNRDVCIHSEYLTNEKFCRALAEANREFNRPVHLHVSETEKEHRECFGRHGKTPIAYLAELGLLDYGGYAAHCVWCTDDDFRIMSEHGVSLVHNPTSNMKLGSGFARVARAKELGVNVALGTDGCASNDNLDMFEEMHLAALIHKGLAKDPTVLDAWEVIEMATANGAKALGRTDTGSLEVGKCADLLFVDMNRPHLTPCLSPENLVVYSMHASDVVMTVVDGEVLYDRGIFQHIDVEKARADLLSAVRRIGL